MTNIEFNPATRRTDALRGAVREYGDRVRGAARADDEHASRGGLYGGRHCEAVRARAKDPPVPDDERVHRPRPLGRLVELVAERDRRQLVRRGHVRAGEPERDDPAHSGLERGRLDAERDVRPVQPASGKRRVLHAGRERAGDRVAEEADEARRAAQHRGPARRA